MTSGPTSPTLFEQCHGFFYVPLQLKYKDEGDKANGLKPPPNDAIIWTEKGVSQLVWSHQLFKDLGWWSGRGFELTTSRSADRRSPNWANRAAVHKKGCALGLILKVRVFGTRKWPIGSLLSIFTCFKILQSLLKFWLNFLLLPC